MKLQNPFPDWVRELWRDAFHCGECGSNGVDTGGVTLHHITSRDSNSPLNSIPLCGDCHIKVGHTQQERQEYFAVSYCHIVIGHGYELQDEDYRHLERHKYLFEKNPFLEILF